MTHTCVDSIYITESYYHYFYIMKTIYILNIVYYLHFFGCIKCFPLAGNQHLSSFIWFFLGICLTARPLRWE